jgi:hypothetical protein
MGEVSLAEDLSMGRRVAVKWLAASGSEAATGDEERERFRREARTLARLDHPHLLKVHRLDEVDGRPFMVLELVEGGSLADRLANRGRLPPTEALSVIRQAVEGLAAAWCHGIVHRDVKPSNLMFDAEDRLKVVDFGLAFPASVDESASRLTRTGFVVGSPHYMSPEQIRGESLDSRSDLYSLGIVLFEMLAGRPPFEGRSQGAILAGHLSEAPPDLGELCPELPAEVVDLVRRLITKDSSNRPGSAREVFERLEACQQALARSELGERPAGSWSLGRRLAPIAVLGLVGLVAVLAWRGSRAERSSAVVIPPAPVAIEESGAGADPFGSLELAAGASGQEIFQALSARETADLDRERLPLGLRFHVARDGGVRVLPLATVGYRPVDGWLVLVATEQPLAPPPVLGARPEGMTVNYPAVLDGASRTVYPAHDLLTWLEQSLGERSGRWQLAVTPQLAPEREAVP